MSMFGADLPCPDNGKADPVSYGDLQMSRIQAVVRILADSVDHQRDSGIDASGLWTFIRDTLERMLYQRSARDITRQDATGCTTHRVMPGVYQQLSIILLRFHMFARSIDVSRYHFNAKHDEWQFSGQGGQLSRQR